MEIADIPLKTGGDMMKTIIITSVLLAVVFFGQSFAQDLTLLGSYDLARPAYELVVDGNYAYLPDADSGLVVLDVSDPENPYQIGQGHSDTRVERIALSGNYIYGAREFYHFPPDSTHFKIIDVTDPASPVLVSTLTVIGHILDLEVKEEYVFTLNAYFNKLNVIDVSDPYDPIQVCSFHVTGSLGRIQVVGNTAYIITLTGHALRIIDISNPVNPVEIGHSPTPGISYDLYVHGDYAYIADNSDLTIIDVSNPASPVVLQDTFQIYTTGRITANDDFVFLGGGFVALEDYFFAINVQNPSDPWVAGSYQMPDNSAMGKPVVANNCVYLPKYDNPSRLLIFNAAITGIEDNPETPENFATLESYPNPFNDKCNITFSIAVESDVEVALYNILGQKVENLFAGVKEPGSYTIGWNAGDNSSGVYFARLTAEDYSKNVKMLLLK
jgi:hypothetical protein